MESYVVPDRAGQSHSNGLSFRFRPVLNKLKFAGGFPREDDQRPNNPRYRIGRIRARRFVEITASFAETSQSEGNSSRGSVSPVHDRVVLCGGIAPCAHGRKSAVMFGSFLGRQPELHRLGKLRDRIGSYSAMDNLSRGGLQ